MSGMLVISWNFWRIKRIVCRVSKRSRIRESKPRIGNKNSASSVCFNVYTGVCCRISRFARPPIKRGQADDWKPGREKRRDAVGMSDADGELMMIGEEGGGNAPNLPASMIIDGKAGILYMLPVKASAFPVFVPGLITIYPSVTKR